MRRESQIARGRSNKVFSAGRQADIFQRADSAPAQRESRGGNQAVLNAARRSDEEHFGRVAPS